ncbi:MAG: DUF1565 domain-containing protein [bacterium]
MLRPHPVSIPRCLLAASLATTLALAMILAGCGGDDGAPAPLSLALDVDSTATEVCASLEVTATVANGDPAMVAWYVNGVLGGNSTTGTVSQSNPATFTAPEAVPGEPTITIRAVSQQDSTKADSCRVTVEFTIIHVNAALGSDAIGTGCITRPFKTIRSALDAASAGMTVLAAAGTYNAAGGEVYPFYIPAGVSLVGENWETTVLQSNLPQMISIAETNCAVRKFTLAEDPGLPSGWNMTILVQSPAESAVLDSLRMSDVAVNANVRVHSTTGTTITDCRFVAEGDPSGGRGFEIIFDDAGTVVRDCVISGFSTGIFLNGHANPLIEGCTIDGNIYGVSLCCYGSDTNNPVPDLGGGARGSLGGNIIRNNTYYGLRNPTKSVIYAKYNTWTHDPPVFGSAYGSDIYNEGTGSVIVE